MTFPPWAGIAPLLLADTAFRVELEALVQDELRAMARLNRAGFEPEHLSQALCSPQ